MKIVYCKENISNSAGTERVLANKANYLVNHGYEVVIITTFQQGQKPFFTFDDRIRIYDLGIDFHAYKKKKTTLSRRIQIRKNINLYLSRLSELLTEIKPDILISTYDKDSRYIYRLKDNSKKVIERHFGKYRERAFLSRFDKSAIGRFFTHFFKLRYYNIIKQCDKFVVLTKEDQELWGNLKNIVVIPNAMSFVPKRISELTNKRIIAVGRLTDQKRFDILLDIWHSIESKYPDWKLSIFGNGELKEALESQIQTLKLENRVELFPPSNDIETELVNSSVFVMTSQYEGFPMVLIEAMSCGLPVVTFSFMCGPKDAITNGEDGFIIPMGDKKQFAEKLSLLIEDEKLRKQIGHKSAQSIQQFSEENVMKQWIQLFQELVEKP